MYEMPRCTREEWATYYKVQYAQCAEDVDSIIEEMKLDGAKFEVTQEQFDSMVHLYKKLQTCYEGWSDDARYAIGEFAEVEW